MVGIGGLPIRRLGVGGGMPRWRYAPPSPPHPRGGRRLPAPVIPSTSPPGRPSFRPDIEGLRGIAVLLVVAYHAAVPGFSGGYIGVDVFFVLSGYLITDILVAEVEGTGRLDLARFYASRARRLLPAIGVLLLGVAAFAAAFYAPLEQGPIATTALATAAYVSNLHFAVGATDYLGNAAETDPLLHTWSLAVEEQFYLVWPLLIGLALGAWRRRGVTGRRRLLGVMAVAGVLSFVLSLYLMGSLRTHWAFFASPPRAWEFAAGGLAALVPRLGAGRLGRGSAFGWVGLTGIVASGVLYTSETAFPGWAAVVPVLGTALVLRAGGPEAETGLGRVLTWRPLREAGRLSYSWYLWHWPVLVFAAGLALVPIHDLPALTRAGLVLLSLGLAEASYRLVENPIRHHARLGRRPAYGLALLAAITLGGVALSVAWRSAAAEAARQPNQQRFAEAVADTGPYACLSDVTDTDLRDCVLGDSTSSTVVVLYGDSHAHQWLPAAERAARERGWRLVPMLKAACPAVDATRTLGQLGRPLTECDVWRAASLDRLDALAPDLVVVTTMEAIYHDIYRDEWVGGTERLLDRLGAASGAVLLVRDTPAPFVDVPVCLSRNARRGAQACAFDPEAATTTPEVFPIQQAAAARLANSSVADFTADVCPSTPCAPVRDDSVIVWRDGHHLTATFARSLAPRLGDAIARALPEAGAR